MVSATRIAISNGFSCEKSVSFINHFFAISVTAVLVLSYKFVSPFRRGFSCSDTSIQKPYVGDSVSVISLLLFALVFPIVLVRTIKTPVQLVSNSREGTV